MKRSEDLSPQTTLPVITAVCMTYRRPDALRNALACFVAQTYPNRRLLVLDDAGLYRTEIDKLLAGKGPNPDWTHYSPFAIISTTRRYRSIAQKFLAACDLARGLWPDTDILCRWDDDDVYLPGFFEAILTDLVETDVAPSPLTHYVKRIGRFAYNLSASDDAYDAVTHVPLACLPNLEPKMDDETRSLYAAASHPPENDKSADVQ